MNKMSVQEVIDVVTRDPGVLQCTLSTTNRRITKILADAGRIERRVVCLLSTRKAAYALFLQEST